MTVSGESLRYDLRDPVIRRNPYPVLARLRREDPVHWSPALSGWLLTRYDDVRRAHVAPELGQGVPDKYERARSGAQNMSAYFRELIAQRRVQPCDDMISRLIAARDNDEALSEDELVASCMLMLFGGHETTTNLIGNAVHALINHPEQRAKLIARPDLIGSTIEEVLRFDGLSNSSARIVVTDHELGGKRLEAGQRVFAMINAGNRDASQFDRAECFDIERTPNRHLTFGQGIHFCMGASLARLEGRIALDTLIRRFPSLGLIDSDPPEWTNAMIMRGLRRLPVS